MKVLVPLHAIVLILDTELVLVEARCHSHRAFDSIRLRPSAWAYHGSKHLDSFATLLKREAKNLHTSRPPDWILPTWRRSCSLLLRRIRQSVGKATSLHLGLDNTHILERLGRRIRQEL